LSGASQAAAAGRQRAVLFASPGQFGPFPGQFSAGSHTPAEARHSTVAALKPLGGQLLFTPSQLSATSQAPAAARHSAVLFTSIGQEPLEPVHVSATSQTPADALPQDAKAVTGALVVAVPYHGEVARRVGRHRGITLGARGVGVHPEVGTLRGAAADVALAEDVAVLALPHHHEVARRVGSDGG